MIMCTVEQRMLIVLNSTPNHTNTHPVTSNLTVITSHAARNRKRID